MASNREAKWQKYKRDFLRANRCTEEEFERDYIAFQESKPDTEAYRRFARKYKITIHPEPRLPVDLQVLLSVNISAMKVMAKTYQESLSALTDIMTIFEPRH